MKSVKESKRSNTQAHDTCMFLTRTNTLGQCHECGQMRENVTCEGVLFTPPVGYNGLPSAVNVLAKTNEKV